MSEKIVNGDFELLRMQKQFGVIPAYSSDKAYISLFFLNILA